MARLTEDVGIKIDESSDCILALIEMRKTKHYLVSLFRDQRCLWDQFDPSYKNIHRKQLAWQEIANSIGKPVSIVRAEMNKLRFQFFREYRKSRKKISSSNDNYVPKWFLYNDLLFLAYKRAASTSNSDGNGIYNSFAEGGLESDNAREEDDRDSWTQISLSSSKCERESATNSDSASHSGLPAQLPIASASGSASARNQFTAQFGDYDYSPTSAHLSASTAYDLQRHAAPESSSESNKNESDNMQRLCLELLAMEAKRASQNEDVFSKFGRFVGDTLRQRPSQFEQLQRRIVAVLFDFNEKK